MITVLLPVYNSEKYLGSAIKSVLNQTFKNFEFLIIDDGSSDNSESIIKSFKDERINFIKKEHSGLANTLNNGLEIAKFDWVARMDADDIAHPTRLKKQVEFITEKSNTIIFTNVVFFSKNKLIFKFYKQLDENKIKENLILHSPIPHPSILYNKYFILENNGYDENLNLAEDYELWLRLKEKAEFKIIDEVLVFARFSSISMSRNNYSNTNSTIYEIQKKYYFDLKKNFNINSKKLQNQYKGWREYFFGNPKLAQKYWLKNPSNLTKFRVFLAFLISFLPIHYSITFRKYNLKLKLEFLFGNILGKNQKIKKNFYETIKLLQY